jgi:hypothetical protein
MDLSRPFRSLIPTLEGPVLEVLARTSRPLTGLEIHRLSKTGSPNGVRLALGRLVEQGLVQAESRGAAVFYVVNRDHLAWPAVEQLAQIRPRLIDRLRTHIESWKIRPVHASLYGSAARGDGDESSDVDVLVVRPGGVEEDTSPWADQVDVFRQHVHAWTGNDCQVFEIDLARLSEYVQAQDELVEDWLRDGVVLAGSRLSSILRGVEP